MGKYKRDEERDRKIYRLREEGKTFNEIGKMYGISATRARQLYFREQWHREQDVKYNL